MIAKKIIPGNGRNRRENYMKLSKRFLEESEVYKLFTPENENLDFSHIALEEMYIWESTGKGRSCNVTDQHTEFLKTGRKINGYAVGKKFQNITVAMWFDKLDPIKTKEQKLGRFLIKEELIKLIGVGWENLLIELREDIFPNWWLNKIFKDFLKSKGIKKIEDL